MEHKSYNTETIKHISINHNNRIFRVKIIRKTSTNLIDIQIVCEPTNEERIEITKYLENYIGE